MRKTILLACVTTMLTLGGAGSFGDVIHMQDGRTFEGAVRGESGGNIEFDAMVAGIRVTLSLEKAQIARHEKKPIPDDFYEAPEPEATSVDHSKFHPDDNLYLIVPLKGELGKTVFTDGVRAAVGYANRNNIGHIVFDINLTGGTIDEAKKLTDMLTRYKQDTTFISLIRNCRGTGLLVPVVSDHLVMLPGGSLGGEPEKLRKLKGDDRAENLALRASIARRVKAYLQQKGHTGLLAAAMIDPEATAVGWKDVGGSVRLTEHRPADLDSDQVIFDAGPGTLLVLSTAQAVELGMEPFEGDIEKLGEYFGIDRWTLESDYGQRMTTRVNESQIARNQRKHAVVENQIASIEQRRQELQASVKHNVKKAAEYDPSKGDYSTYASNWGWGGWHKNYRYSGGDNNRLTDESRLEWKRRTRTAMGYLKRAARDAAALMRLEDQGEKLGLKRLHSREEVKRIADDMNVKYNFLAANYNKRYK